MLPTQLDQLAREAEVIDHLPVAAPRGRPSAAAGRGGKSKLSDHCLSSRNSWPMKSIGIPGAVRLMRGGDPRAAAAVPRTRIARVAEPRDALLAVAIDDVVILRSLHELPVLVEAVRPQAAREPGHVERPLVGRAGVRR